jgi:hypothetical protein
VVSDTFDRAARTPLLRQPRRWPPVAQGLRRAAWRLAAARSVSRGREDDSGMAELMVAVAALVAEIAAYHEERRCLAQAAAARRTGRVLPRPSTGGGRRGAEPARTPPTRGGPRRPVTAAAAAAVLIAIGAGAGVLLSGGSSPRTVQAQVVAPSAPAARASLTVDDGRTTLRVRNFPAPPRGRIYQVWLKRPGRDPDPTNALFGVRNGSAEVEVPGSVRGVDQVLVTDEPGGGSRAPTRSPVIIAQPA